MRKNTKEFMKWKWKDERTRCLSHQSSLFYGTNLYASNTLKVYFKRRGSYWRKKITISDASDNLKPDWIKSKIQSAHLLVPMMIPHKSYKHSSNFSWNIVRAVRTDGWEKNRQPENRTTPPFNHSGIQRRNVMRNKREERGSKELDREVRKNRLGVWRKEYKKQRIRGESKEREELNEERI